VTPFLAAGRAATATEELAPAQVAAAAAQPDRQAQAALVQTPLWIFPASAVPEVPVVGARAATAAHRRQTAFRA
jgi:hypothetical protein